MKIGAIKPDILAVIDAICTSKNYFLVDFSNWPGGVLARQNDQALNYTLYAEQTNSCLCKNMDGKVTLVKKDDNKKPEHAPIKGLKELIAKRKAEKLNN